MQNLITSFSDCLNGPPGPLIIGVAFTAVAVGAALSAGALFTSLFLPFFIFIGLGSLFFMGATFASVATLGVGLLLPKIISLVGISSSSVPWGDWKGTLIIARCSRARPSYRAGAVRCCVCGHIACLGPGCHAVTTPSAPKSGLSFPPLPPCGTVQAVACS